MGVGGLREAGLVSVGKLFSQEFAKKKERLVRPLWCDIISPNSSFSNRPILLFSPTLFFPLQTLPASQLVFVFSSRHVRFEKFAEIFSCLDQQMPFI